MPPRLELAAGQKFGRWTVLAPAGTDGHFSLWKCICKCGTKRVMKGYKLTTSSTARSRSCGCLRRDKAAINGAKRKTHGESNHGPNGYTSEYLAWCGMKARCYNSKRADYKDYGGRGIMICKRWSTFENFLADMGRKPSPQHSIDRINNSGNYTPSNCRWATKEEQTHNRRKRK